MNLIAQTRLGDAGLIDFRKKLRKTAGITIRRIKEEGFEGVNPKYRVWRRKNIVLMQSLATGAYIAEENYAWDQQPPPVANFNKYYRRKKCQ